MSAKKITLGLVALVGVVFLLAMCSSSPSLRQEKVVSGEKAVVMAVDAQMTRLEKSISEIKQKLEKVEERQKPRQRFKIDLGESSLVYDTRVNTRPTANGISGSDNVVITITNTQQVQAQPVQPAEVAYRTECAGSGGQRIIFVPTYRGGGGNTNIRTRNSSLHVSNSSNSSSSRYVSTPSSSSQHTTVYQQPQQTTTTGHKIPIIHQTTTTGHKIPIIRR